MNITASFHGILADWIGTRSASFNLPSGATYTDLMAAIRRRYAHNMPDQLWDERKNTFKKQVIISGRGAISNLINVPLKDNDVVEFLLMIAGG
jgi:hypothetical protein